MKQTKEILSSYLKVREDYNKKLLSTEEFINELSKLKQKLNHESSNIKKTSTINGLLDLFLVNPN